MKIEAYICDVCGKLTPHDDTVGVSLQPDMFDVSASFPTIPNPAKADAHYCVDKCYADKVLINARVMSKNEIDYALRITELSYLLRAAAVNSYNKKRFKERRLKV